MGKCRYCGQNAGFLRFKHGQCEARYRAGMDQMTSLVSQAAGTPDFREAALRQTLSSIAAQAYASEDDINTALSRGWTQGVSEAMADGVLTRQEEESLRNFRDRMALEDDKAVRSGIATLDAAATNRLDQLARAAAIEIGPQANNLLQELEDSINSSGFSREEARQLQVRAWEEAVEGALEDGIISLDEENALTRFLTRFGLSARHVNDNGAHTSMVQSAVLRDLSQGIVPQRQQFPSRLPFNLMKSEQLVWVIDGVGYVETITRRERQGSSQGVSIRVARGVYYRPSSFRSRSVEWEETKKVDDGMLGLTTKHVYFAGSRKRFRVRYDRIVAFEPYRDGFGIMRDAQTAKPQNFVTGDGWFAYNLVFNLAQM